MPCFMRFAQKCYCYMLYCVTQRVVVVIRVTSPFSALTSPITSVLSLVWHVRSGGGGGAMGGGGGGLAQPPRMTAQSARGVKMRFPRLFIGPSAKSDRQVCDNKTLQKSSRRTDTKAAFVGFPAHRIVKTDKNYRTGSRRFSVLLSSS